MPASLRPLPGFFWLGNWKDSGEVLKSPCLTMCLCSSQAQSLPLEYTLHSLAGPDWPRLASVFVRNYFSFQSFMGVCVRGQEHNCLCWPDVSDPLELELQDIVTLLTGC